MQFDPKTLDPKTQAIVCVFIPKEEKVRIESHPLRGERSLQDFQSELILRALDQPEFVRREEATKDGIPDGYYDAEIKTIARVDSEREVFHIVLRIVRGPLKGRAIVHPLWYPPAESDRRGPHQHFNLAVGLAAHDRLFGRELEVEGTRIVVKYWQEATADGLQERVHFIKAAAEEAA